MFNSVVSMFVCVCGLIVEHQWSHNFDGSNLYEWLQYIMYIEYEKKSAWKYLLFSIQCIWSDIWSTKKVLKALKLQI